MHKAEYYLGSCYSFSDKGKFLDVQTHEIKDRENQYYIFIFIR